MCESFVTDCLSSWVMCPKMGSCRHYRSCLHVIPVMNVSLITAFAYCTFGKYRRIGQKLPYFRAYLRQFLLAGPQRARKQIGFGEADLFAPEFTASGQKLMKLCPKKGKLWPPAHRVVSCMQKRSLARTQYSCTHA